jgi:hypothetical protein
MVGMTPGTHQPAPISGVVDGELIAAYDPDGTLCLHLVFGTDPLSDGVHVEFVLSHDGARVLQRSLENGLRSTVDPLPCRVGIRLRHGRP